MSAVLIEPWIDLSWNDPDGAGEEGLMLSNDTIWLSFGRAFVGTGDIVALGERGVRETSDSSVSFFGDCGDFWPCSPRFRS